MKNEHAEVVIKKTTITKLAQFLCVKSGGKLVQHLDGHTSSHEVKIYSGKQFSVTSSHHQMMLPTGAKHHILAESLDRKSNRYLTEKGDIKVAREYEMVYFPDTKALAVQWHPEWMDSNTIGYNYPIDVLHFLMEK